MSDNICVGWPFGYVATECLVCDKLATTIGQLTIYVTMYCDGQRSTLTVYHCEHPPLWQRVAWVHLRQLMQITMMIKKNQNRYGSSACWMHTITMKYELDNKNIKI